MPTATYETIVQEVEQLTPEEQARLIEYLEELADIRAYDAVKASLAAGEDEIIPLDQAIAELEAKWASERDAA